MSLRALSGYSSGILFSAQCGWEGQGLFAPRPLSFASSVLASQPIALSSEERASKLSPMSSFTMSTAASFFGLKEGFLPLLEGSQGAPSLSATSSATLRWSLRGSAPSWPRRR